MRRKKQGRIIPFSKEQLMMLFNSIQNPKLAVATLLALRTGMRRSEVCSLKIDWINWDNLTIYHPNTKGGKERYYYIDSRIANILKLWISMLGKTPWLFPSQEDPSKHIKACGLYSTYKKQLQQCNLWLVDESHEGKFTRHIYNFHSLRKTFASLLVQNDVEVFTASKLLGHSKLETTLEFYTQLGSPKMRGDLQKVFGKDSNPITRKTAKKVELPQPKQPISPPQQNPLQELKIKLVNGDITIGEFKERSKALMEFESIIKENSNCNYLG